MPVSEVSEDAADAGLRTVKEAARFLGVSRSQIYRLGQSEAIELVKVGERATRVTQASLTRFVKNAKRMIPQRVK